MFKLIRDYWRAIKITNRCNKAREYVKWCKGEKNIHGFTTCPNHGFKQCPINHEWCVDTTFEDWYKALRDRDEGGSCGD